MHHIIRRGLASGITAACVLGLAATPSIAAGAGTEPAVTETSHQHRTWTEPGDTDFCTGEAVTPTITGNEVEHLTYFPGGDEAWGTFTEEGNASFEQPSTGLTYSGRVTVWGNFNVNEKNANSTFTATFTLTAVDPAGGTHLEIGHQVAHVGWDAADQEPVVNFEKMSLTCS